MITVCNAPVRLSFPVGHFQHHWEQCGLTANLLATISPELSPYMTTVVSTVLNEMIENAVKYAATPTSLIELMQWVTDRGIECEVTNTARPNDANNVLALCDRLSASDSDPDAMFYEALEVAGSATDASSQLGLLGIVQAYNVKLGCSVQQTDHGQSTVSVKAVIYVSEEERV